MAAAAAAEAEEGPLTTKTRQVLKSLGSFIEKALSKNSYPKDMAPAPALDCKLALAGTPAQASLCSSIRKNISGIEVKRTPEDYYKVTIS